jgi:hypothetical protein
MYKAKVVDGDVDVDVDLVFDPCQFTPHYF